MQYISDPF